METGDKPRAEDGHVNLSIPPSSAESAKNATMSTVTEKASVVHTNCVLGTGGGSLFLAMILI